MKNKFVLSSVLFLTIIVLKAQQVKDKNVVDQLQGICKVWGFLKYYSPYAGSGQIDWDQELVTTLPRLYQPLSKEAYGAIIDSMILKASALPSIKQGKVRHFYRRELPCDYNNLHFDWIDTSVGYSAGTKAKLHNILIHFVPKCNIYVDQENTFIGIKKSSKNSIAFAIDTVNTPEIRLLAFFKLWNVLYYFYPYNELIEFNYDDILSSYIPPFYNAKSDHDCVLLYRELTGKLCDTHTIVSSKKEYASHSNYYTIPVEIIDAENKKIIGQTPDSIEQQYHLRGSEILKMNGENIGSRMAELSRYYQRARPEITEREVNFQLSLSYTDSIFDLIVKDSDNTTREVKLPGNHMGLFFVENLHQGEKSCRFLNDSIYYVNLKLLKLEDLKSMYQNIKRSKYLIIDYRNMFGFKTTPVWSGMARMLIAKAVNYYVSYPFDDWPGKFYNIKWTDYPASKKPYNGNIIILANYFDQSSYEFDIQTFCDGAKNKVTIVGSTTGGACGVAGYKTLPGKIYVQYTVSRANYEGHNTFEKVGIKPDLLVKPTIEGVRNGYDEALDAAFNLARYNFHKME